MKINLFRRLPILLLFRAFSEKLWPFGGSGSFGFWLRFRSVTGHFGHAPSLSLAKTPKSLAAERLQFFFKRSSAAFLLLLLAAGCATNMRSYNQDYGQNLPVAPKYTVENVDDTHFKIIVHQGEPLSGPERIVYLKEATAAIAQNEATHRGWKSWRVDYIQQRDQGWMHVLIAIVTR